jgi:Tol biopolymer transport system component
MVSSLLVAVVALAAGHGTAGGAGQSGASEAIVFERKGDLYAATVDGSRTVQLTKTRILELEPAVSPDGRSIAYARRSPRGYKPHYSPARERDLWEAGVDLTGGELWTMGVDGRRRMRLTRASHDAGPAWSADGERIFFSRVVDGEYWQPCRSVFRVRKDGRELRRLTRIVRKRPGGPSNPVTAPRDLAVSPDGRRIAFTDRITCETTDVLPFLKVVDASGRRRSDLSRQPYASVDAGNADPTWSPDGDWIAFHRTSQGHGGIYIANRDGSGVHQVTKDPEWARPSVVVRWDVDRVRRPRRSLRDPSRRNGSPSAHSDEGARILPRVATADANGSMSGTLRVTVVSAIASILAVPIVSESSARHDDAKSAGGPKAKIAFVSGPNLDLYVISADGSRRRRLTRGPTNERPAWSPDGRRIAFAFLDGRTNRSGAGIAEDEEIHVIDADGSRLRRLTRNPDGVYNESPAWSPNGRRIAFIRNTNLLLINVDGSGLRRLAQAVDLEYSERPACTEGDRAVKVPGVNGPAGEVVRMGSWSSRGCSSHVPVAV